MFPAELADQDLGLRILWPLVSWEAVPLALKAVFEPNFTPGERRIQRHVCCVSTSVVCVNFDGCCSASKLYVCSANNIASHNSWRCFKNYFGMASEVKNSTEADILRERKKGSSTTIIWDNNMIKNLGDFSIGLFRSIDIFFWGIWIVERRIFRKEIFWVWPRKFEYYQWPQIKIIVVL